jgi:hypothetical protein
MSAKRTVQRQRRAMKLFLRVFCSVIAAMWVATALDFAFELDWGWDQQILWTAPLMVIFAGILSIFAKGIFQFVERNY